MRRVTICYGALAALLVVLVFGTPEAQAQCAKEENGITVELLADGSNTGGTYSYIWGVTYELVDPWITSATFQTTGAAVTATGVEPQDPWFGTSTSWSVAPATLGASTPAVAFTYDAGLKLQRDRTFRVSYTTAMQDPIRVVVQSSNGDTFDQFFTDVECALLPVELTRFDAVLDGAATRLAWATASEVNNAGFEVQHAAREAGFEAIAFVEGAGTTREARTYAFRTETLDPGVHRFRLKQLDYDGTFAYSPEVEVVVGLPGTYELSAAYPNPFNPQTRFTLAVSQEQHVRVEVFDALGRRVAVLHDGRLPAGAVQAFTFDAGGLAGGLYLYRATGEHFAATRRAMLLK